MVPACSDRPDVPAEPSGGIDLTELLRNLGLVAGLIRAGDARDSVEVDSDWFQDPIASLREMPSDRTRRAALAELIAGVLPTPDLNPTLDKTGRPDSTVWLPFPHPSTSAPPAPEAADAPAAGKPAPTGAYLLTNAEPDALVLGLGLMTTTTVGSTAVTPFAAIPLVSLPSPAGDPVLFVRDGVAFPVVVGVRVTAPSASIGYGGSNYDTLHIQAGFDVTDPAHSSAAAFVRAGKDTFVSVGGGPTSVSGLVDVVLGIDDVVAWLDHPIGTGAVTGPSVGAISVAAGLLAKEQDRYALASFDLVEHLTLPTLLEHFLPALDGVRLVGIHDSPTQGLFVVATADSEAKTTRYGLRLAIADIDLSPDPSDPLTAPGDGSGDATAGSDPGTTSLTLQLGSGFEPKPPAKPPGRTGGTGDAMAEAFALGAAASREPGGPDDEGGNWTNSDRPLGVSLTLLHQDDQGVFGFAAHLDLVSVGLDYSNDGPNGLVNAKGFQFAGVQPRLYLSFGETFGFGAAIRIEDLELPLDATLGAKTASSNPVADNLISSKSDATVPAGSKLPPARTKFSASAALDAHETFHATLYDADRKPTDKPISFKVEQSFGPISLQKLGVGWVDAERTLSISVDGGVNLGGLGVDLKELSVSFPVTDFAATRLGLKGMDIRFEAGGIEISGGFVEIDSPQGVEYDGMVLVKAAGFTLSALGGYGVLDHHPSLFVFLLLDIPLGGPPVFFVNGLAGGFGYNRDLKMPSIDALPQFPLVQGAMAGTGADNPFGDKKDPASALGVLAADVPPAYGEYWIAAGVRFSSFELIESFALLTVKFGTTFEIDLLGLSRASIPPLASDPIANVEMALLVTFAPDRGFVGVSAKLTDRSYVFSKTCHLTGGFAFYLWFKDDTVTSAPAGQFVVTLGGYHPYFVPPEYYPDEPRLGLNWKVSDALNISGGLYFALTPGAIMAGGYLDALFDAGIVTAWFKAHADFLLGWKPFYYAIGIGIDLGARIRLPLLITTVVITIEVGVDLELWGPAFGGHVVVHLLFISFTIPFGSSSPTPLPIGWAEFAGSFLPASKEAKTAVAPAPDQHVCDVRVGAGLLKDLTDNPAVGVDWVVDPLHVQFVVSSTVPIKQVDIVTHGGIVTPLTPAGVVTDFGVGPMAIEAVHFDSAVTITVERTEHPEAFDFAASIDVGFVERAAPRATWDKAAAFNTDVKALNASPLTIGGTLQGITLQAVEKAVDHTRPISLTTLQGSPDQIEGTLEWSKPAIPVANPFAPQQPNAMSVLTATVAAPEVAATRLALAVELARRGLPITRPADLGDARDHGAEVLLGAPVLCPLGFPAVVAATP